MYTETYVACGEHSLYSLLNKSGMCREFSKVIQYQMLTPFNFPAIFAPTHIGDNKEVNRHQYS
jgi:hypothetical protein